MRLTRCLEACVLLGVVLVGCAHPLPSAPPGSSLPSPVAPSSGSAAPSASAAPEGSADPGSLGFRYSCGRIPFNPAVLAGPGGAETGADPIGAALREHLAQGGPDIDALPDTGWILLGATPAVAELAARDAAGRLTYVIVEQNAGQWKVGGWGGCRPTAVLENASLATFDYAADEIEPVPETRSFDVVVTERACTSGQPMGERLLPPAIDYGEEQITIIFAAVPLPGGHDCQGNPSTRVTVELDQPVGDRAVVDGAFFPPGDPGVIEE